MKVAVVGASGYTGLELLRILLRHPELEPGVSARSDDCDLHVDLLRTPRLLAEAETGT